MHTIETTDRTTTRDQSVFGLVGNLTGEIQTFIKQEINLAKTEITEKLSTMGKNGAALAVGGAIAYAGLIVFLIGVGVILGYGFQALGLPSWVAAFIGLAVVGLLSAGMGGILVLKALATFKKTSLAPQRTIHTLQELKTGHEEFRQSGDQEPPSSEEIQARVEATEARMTDTLDELGSRLSPHHINAVVKARVRRQPYRFGAVAMGLGVASGFLLRRKMRHAPA